MAGTPRLWSDPVQAASNEMVTHPAKNRLILLTGSSGYIGGRLLPLLARNGYPVRCLARRPSELKIPLHSHVEVVRGDVLDAHTLQSAMQGVDTAYYLVHSLSTHPKFEDADRLAAQNFGAAARAAGVRRIIYLGGLGGGSELSQHLRSRQEVGQVLRSSGVPVVEFRASIVIGSGSLSFEIIRMLVERLPVMIAPKWVACKAQPIAVEDVLAYLQNALELPVGQDGVIEIGGADVVSYGDIMKQYARQRGLRRWIIPVPVLTPRLSSLWLSLVTPAHAESGRRLIDGLKNPTIVTNHSALQIFEWIHPMSTARAVERALANEDSEFADSQWAATQSAEGSRNSQWGGRRYGSRLVDTREIHVNVPPALAFEPIERIGGKTGWYYADFLWSVRGWLDQLVGGPGLRRGRRAAEDLLPGDALDFWRVEKFAPGRLLRLHAEMKLPGRAWLQFEVTPEGTGALIRQTAVFYPLGLLGLLYWYSIYPIHAAIFRGMLRNIARASEHPSGPQS
jgi:uncharacterized protein YbjT (DUF2867 family)